MAISPPRPKSFPLTALRAFESAARLGGFSAAAEELGVSAGAVSAHVKSLEEGLGTDLFTRTPRGVTLTPVGHRVLPGFSRAFDSLGDAVQELRAEASPHVVHIAALPAIAQFWLSPRLPKLRAVAPEVSISVTAMERPPNLKRAPFDLCLFYEEDSKGRLCEDIIFPVCAPSFVSKLGSPKDLSSVPCLTDTTWENDWSDWAKTALGDQHFVPRGPVFSLYSLAIEETINGAGVLMGHEALIAPFIQSGALVAPFECRVPLNNGLRMWSLRNLPKTSPAGRVERWLRESR